ncbi:DUF4407 domain-containing protein [Algoriphagus boritolerans]|uniref:DUF4407 domain-containing protein n=1 Tax=Algoriphagus boritolerans TaxID=308111 RepID=UPI000AD81AB6
MQHITRFFWFCSGANFALLKRAPTESNKYFGIGATVFFTGVFAALAAGYALFTVFQSLVPAIFFGLLWGLMIFNLDRFIVSSMRKRENAWTEWKLAIPRLVLAVLLALVISKPIELKMFEREINRKLDEKKTEFIAQSKANLAKGFPEIQELEAKIDSLKSEVSQAESFRDQLQTEYDSERFGEKTSGTSGIVGLGTHAKKKEVQLDAAQLALDELRKRNQVRVDTIEAQIREFITLRQAEFEKQLPGIEGFDGLAARMDALSVLTRESSAMAMANIFIMLLFIAIETAPIFVKLISARGPYDELLELHEEKVKLFKGEKWTKAKGESEARVSYFQDTHFYATDLNKEKNQQEE